MKYSVSVPILSLCFLLSLCPVVHAQSYNRVLLEEDVTITPAAGSGTSYSILVDWDLLIDDFGASAVPLNFSTDVFFGVNGSPVGIENASVIVAGGGGGALCDSSCEDSGCSDKSDDDNTFQCKSYLFSCYCGTKVSLALSGTVTLQSGDVVSVGLAAASGALPETVLGDESVDIVFVAPPAVPGSNPYLIAVVGLGILCVGITYLKRR